MRPSSPSNQARIGLSYGDDARAQTYATRSAEHYFAPVALLLVLFAPLERLVVRGERLTGGFALTVIALVFLLLVGGILIERRRPEQ